MKKKPIALIAALFVFALLSGAVPVNAAFKDAGWGVRPLGMAGAFTAVADDSGAPMFNPAGISSISVIESSFMSSKLFTGLEGVDLGMNYFSFLYPVSPEKGNFAVSWASLSSAGLYREDTAVISYGRGLNDIIGDIGSMEISGGVNLKYLRHQYDLDKRTRIDPVFADGDSASAVTGDIGVLVRWTDIDVSAGLVSRNITSPDVGLKSADTVPTENVLAVAYYSDRLKYLQIPEFTGAVDIVSRDNDIDVRVGAESLLFDDRFAVRAGARAQEIAFGLGYALELRPGMMVVIDYAMGWPLEVEETTGTHRLGVTVRLPK